MQHTRLSSARHGSASARGAAMQCTGRAGPGVHVSCSTHFQHLRVRACVRVRVHVHACGRACVLVRYTYIHTTGTCARCCGFQPSSRSCSGRGPNSGESHRPVLGAVQTHGHRREHSVPLTRKHACQLAHALGWLGAPAACGCAATHALPVSRVTVVPCRAWPVPRVLGSLSPAGMCG